MTLKIESRGTPPYLIWTATSDICPQSQHSTGATYKEAIEVFFDLTDGGRRSTWKGQITSAHIKDSNGETVMSMDNPKDVKLLKKIDMNGLDALEIIPRKIPLSSS